MILLNESAVLLQEEVKCWSLLVKHKTDGVNVT